MVCTAQDSGLLLGHRDSDLETLSRDWDGVQDTIQITKKAHEAHGKRRLSGQAGPTWTFQCSYFLGSILDILTQKPHQIPKRESRYRSGANTTSSSCQQALREPGSRPVVKLPQATTEQSDRSATVPRGLCKPETIHPQNETPCHTPRP